MRVQRLHLVVRNSSKQKELLKAQLAKDATFGQEGQGIFLFDQVQKIAAHQTSNNWYLVRILQRSHHKEMTPLQVCPVVLIQVFSLGH